MNRPDPHSYFDSTQPRMQHLFLTINVGPEAFKARQIKGKAVITFNKSGAVDLDTRDLQITQVDGGNGEEIAFQLGEADPILGRKLSFVMPEGNLTVTIIYTTSPNATGLQWLTPEQTSTGKPFLFSQGECIHARSYVPCQDSPGVRFTYRGIIIVPREMRGLMAATHNGVDEFKGFGGHVNIEHWKMTRPIPAYLIAFAVGVLESRDLSDRCRVWAEPSVIDKAALEFEDVPEIMRAAEELFGAYPWDRYDMLVMPTAFPFGGMENQGLTFLSPSMLAGDKSMIGIIAHELTHSWFGNLVTNATWSDFWLNEGWTTWGEGRIGEVIFGLPVANLERAIMHADMLRDMQRFVVSDTPELTKLAWNLDASMDPDDAFSRVPYSMGSQFIAALEQHVGREPFDVFVRKYLAAFTFQSITTSQFLAFLEEHLPGAFYAVNGNVWVYKDGMPENAEPITSPLIDEVASFADNALIPPEQQCGHWHSLQWAIYLERFLRPATLAQLRELDQQFNLAGSGNMDIRFNFALLAAESGRAEMLATIADILGSTGRTRYLRPIYKALAEQGGICKEFARATYERLRPTYHPIARKSVENAFAETK